MTDSSARRRWDRHLWLAILLAALVIVPRSYLIFQAHSEYVDDEYHLIRGIRYLHASLGRMRLNDPPLGAALGAVPLVLTGNTPGEGESVLHGRRWSPQTLLKLIAVWKALLFLPLVGVVFYWLRSLYNVYAAWVGTALLVLEPNFAAHIPTASLDVLGVQGIVIACFLAWRFYEKPTRWRLAAAGVAMGTALMLKHTAVLLPAVVLVYAGLWWGLRPWLAREPWQEWRAALRVRVRSLVTAAVVVGFTIWALTLFNISKPRVPERWRESEARLAELGRIPVPAGIYVGSFMHGWSHAQRGHRAYLFGERRRMGWWYYFPAVSTYKVPIGAAAVMLLGLASLAVVRPRWGEWGLAIPMAAYAAFLMNSTINIGFRHFLPAYIFMLMLAARCVAGQPGARKTWLIPAWLGVAAAGIHAASYHPDYIAYLNFSRQQPHLAINDSNLDWGQGLKQVRRWIDQNPQPGRTIYLRYFGRPESPNIGYYLGDRVTVVELEDPQPADGVLIISPVWEAGVYDPPSRYRALQAIEPMDMIGRSMLVYDLDELFAEGFSW